MENNQKNQKENDLLVHPEKSTKNISQ